MAGSDPNVGGEDFMNEMLQMLDGSLGTIDDLAQQYAEYFGTHTHDVTARMEELQHRQMAQNSASFCNSKNEINLPDSDKRSSFQTFEDTSKGREETARPRPQSLKNIQNQRGSEETASCRGCGGVNFVASEIKMSDEDRIRLMNMVKDNRISIDEALAKQPSVNLLLLMGVNQWGLSMLYPLSAEHQARKQRVPF
uniref:Uncharacterized protein n=1 Tax=Eptatretus burgeri TaxID=7764 RepID=A0A8C4Q2Z9_EPTBU